MTPPRPLLSGRTAAAVAAAALVVAAGCTVRDPQPQPSPPAPTSQPSPAPGDATDLPAVDPPAPTRRAFVAATRAACLEALDALAAAPLAGDPFVPDARPAALPAAEARYRTAASAWKTMADTLWEFGLPETRAARRLITQLDTLAQYSEQAAALMAEGDLEAAQSSIRWAAQAQRRAERAAQRLGAGRLSDCAAQTQRLPGARSVVVNATEFTFDVPPLRQGPVRFVVRNRGTEDHHLFVVRLRRSGDLARALAADRENGRPGRFLADPGVASEIVAPGGRGSVDVRLEQGPIALLCFVASPDGTPHAYKGMAVETTVR